MTINSFRVHKGLKKKGNTRKVILANSKSKRLSLCLFIEKQQ